MGGVKRSEVRKIPFESLRDPSSFKNCYNFWTGISFSVIVSANPSLPEMTVRSHERHIIDSNEVILRKPVTRYSSLY